MAATKISATEKRTMINRVKARIAAGTLTMSAAALELNISRSTLSRWLSAEVNDTPVEEVKASIKTKRPSKRKPKPSKVKMPKASAKMKAVKTISLPSALVVAIGGDSYEVKVNHPEYTKIKDQLESVEAIDAETEKALLVLINGEVIEKVKEWSDGKLEIKNGVVRWEGTALQGRLAKVLIATAQSGDTEALSRFGLFIDKVNQAISFKVTNRLFDFLDANNLRIDNDGDIIGFKVVRANYTDKHTGTFDNSVGQVVSMPRNHVDDRDEVTCSNGLHFCSYDYIKSFSSNGDRLVLVKVDPRDFVSVPVDYGSTKARVCRYKVVEDVTTKFLSKDGTFVKEYTQRNQA